MTLRTFHRSPAQCYRPPADFEPGIDRASSATSCTDPNRTAPSDPGSGAGGFCCRRFGESWPLAIRTTPVGARHRAGQRPDPVDGALERVGVKRRRPTTSKSAVNCNLRNENGHICETAPLAQGRHVDFLTSASACPFCNTARKSVALGIKRLGRALPVRAKIYTSLTQGRSPWRGFASCGYENLG